MRWRPPPDYRWVAQIVTAMTVGLLLVTAILVRPGIYAFLMFTMMVGGAGTVLLALIHWGNRHWSGTRSLSMGSFGFVLLLWVWLEMSVQPDGIPAVYRLPMVFVLMLPKVALMREESRGRSERG